MCAVGRIQDSAHIHEGWWNPFRHATHQSCRYWGHLTRNSCEVRNENDDDDMYVRDAELLKDATLSIALGVAPSDTSHSAVASQ